MASKMTKQFKERINQEKKKRVENNISYVDKKNSLIVVPITHHTIAKIKTHIDLEQEEVKCLILDVFNVKKSFKLGERIETSRYCDCYFDLLYNGARLVEGVQEACFTVC